MKLTQKTLTTLVAMSLMGGMWATPTLAKMGHKGPDFATLDANGDGFLTKAEMVAHAQSRFTTADTDNDGALTKAEMIAAAKARAEAHGKEVKEERITKRIDKMMDRHDANKDGKLTQDEMPKKRGQDRLDRMFSKLDADGDGKISEAEFEARKGKRKSKS